MYPFAVRSPGDAFRVPVSPTTTTQPEFPSPVFLRQIVAPRIFVTSTHAAAAARIAALIDSRLTSV